MRLRSIPGAQNERIAQFSLLLRELRHAGQFFASRRGDLASNFALGGRLFSQGQVGSARAFSRYQYPCIHK